MPAGRRTVLCIALLTVCVLATFGRVIGHDFVNFDDEQFIQRNPDFNRPTLSGLLRYWRGPYYGGAFPVTYMALGGIAAVARDANTGELDPRVFHAVSVALHLTCTMLAFLILRLLVHDDTAAALGAAVFAVHPLQVESVAWVTNINTLLEVAFALAALYGYLVYAKREYLGEPRERLRVPFILATVCFVLAMLNKPIAVTLPLVAAALDLWVVGRDWRRVWKPVALWLAVAFPFVLATKLMLAEPRVYHPPMWSRPLIALDAIGFYLAKLVSPLRLIADYGRSPRWLLAQPPNMRWPFAAVAVVAGATVLALARRHRWLAAAAIAFVAPLLPVLGLADFHFQKFSTVADRYVYLSMLGVSLALACILSWRTWWVPRVACAALVVLLALLSHRQAAHWRDTQTLFAHTLSVNPDSFAAHTILGYEARRRNDNLLASVHYNNALAVNRDDPATNFNLARILLERGDIAAALAHFERALATKPDDPHIRNNYGVALARAGRWREAEAQFAAVLATFPDHADARRNLAIVRAKASPASQPASQAASQPAP